MREIANGLALGQLYVVYQPQLDLRTGRVCGAEALVRWSHPSLGAVSPADFLPLAEASGIISDVDRFVLGRACADFASWRSAGCDDLRLAVNVSVRSLEDAKFRRGVRTVHERYAMPADRLELEVTESAAVRSGSSVINALAALQARGVLIALDDFGVGYSMLDRLRVLPFNALKIDRSLIAALDKPSGPQLVTAAIALGHALDLRVVAEGVETEDQLSFLVNQGCDEAQGYLLGRPMPARELMTSLASRASLPRPTKPKPVAADRGAIPRLVRPLLAELARLTDLESTYLTTIDREADEQVILIARNAGALQIGEGLHIPWQDTVCKRSLESGIACTSDVMATFPDSPAAAALGLQTYVGVPIPGNDGRPWGTLCGASVEQRSVGPAVVTVMEAFARLIAAELQHTRWRV